MMPVVVDRYLAPNLFEKKNKTKLSNVIAVREWHISEAEQWHDRFCFVSYELPCKWSSSYENRDRLFLIFPAAKPW